jgi:hypothetical protein
MEHFNALETKSSCLVKQSPGCMACKICHIRKLPPLVIPLTEVNPAHNLIPCFFKTQFFLSCHVYLCCPSFFLTQICRQKKCTVKYPPISFLWFDYRSGVWCWIQVMTLLLCCIRQSAFTSFFSAVFSVTSLSAFCCYPLWTKWKYVSMQCVLCPKKLCLFVTFPNFSRLSLW